MDTFRHQGVRIQFGEIDINNFNFGQKRLIFNGGKQFFSRNLHFRYFSGSLSNFDLYEPEKENEQLFKTLVPRSLSGILPTCHCHD